MKMIQFVATFDKETKRTLRYQLDAKSGITGSIYVQKDQVTTPYPKTLTVGVQKP